MNKKRGIGLMTTGLLLIAAALCLTIYNQWDDLRAEKAAQCAQEQLSQKIALQRKKHEMTEEPIVPDYLIDSDAAMPVMTLDGEDYIGILELPTYGLTLPVMKEWSYPKLKTAPCRYAGSAYTEDLVIAAHNYARHFGSIKALDIGDPVNFTDVDGNVFAYEVAAVELLEPTDIEKMTSSGWDLTLFTCTRGGRARVTVRCEKIAA